MKFILVCCIAVFTTASGGSGVTAQQGLEARFIGNMAYAISDGTITLFSDFPYESGYSRYMTYDAREIRSLAR